MYFHYSSIEFIFAMSVLYNMYMFKSITFICSKVQESSYKSLFLFCYRSAAYNLLCALTCTFNLKIEGQLLETSGLCIPANNTLFIVSISKTLAANEPHLTLEFLEECISGFSKSSK